MIILNQDHDEIFTLSDKGFLFRGRIYVRAQYFQGRLMGWNIIGEKLTRKTLLGTYDYEDEARQIVEEIYKLAKARKGFYAMPEPSIDLMMWR